MNPNPKNAVAYIRVSTEEQAKEGYSIPAQKERLAAFAKSQGWMLTEYYIEEGKSAKDLNRPAAQKMLADIQKETIDIILVYRLDRLTRSVIDLHTLLQDFEKHNVAFRSVTEIFDTTTATGRLFITLVALMAQWERENLAERVRFGMAEMARQGRRPGTKEPYGYSYTNDGDGGLEINEDEAAVVRKMFSLYMQGKGIRKIVAHLNDSGIKSKTGTVWYDNTVSAILKNPLYVGQFRWDGKAIDGSHDPIIEMADFLAVQDKLARRKKIPPRHASGNFPLTGILKCGKCGSSINGATATQRNQQGSRKVRWYKCSRRDHAQTCDMPFCRAETLEEQVLDWLDRVWQMDELGSQIEKEYESMASEQESEVKKLEAELQTVSVRKNKWFDAYEAGVIGIEDLNERLKAVTDKEASARQRLAEIQEANKANGIDLGKPASFADKLKKIKSFRWMWEKADPQEQKDLAHELIKGIVVLPDKSIDVTLN